MTDPVLLIRRLREDAAELAASDLSRASRLVAGVLNLLGWAAEALEAQQREVARLGDEVARLKAGLVEFRTDELRRRVPKLPDWEPDDDDSIDDQGG